MRKNSFIIVHNHHHHHHFRWLNLWLGFWSKYNTKISEYNAILSIRHDMMISIEYISINLFILFGMLNWLSYIVLKVKKTWNSSWKIFSFSHFYILALRVYMYNVWYTRILCIYSLLVLFKFLNYVLLKLIHRMI